jgi:hypothetical protein
MNQYMQLAEKGWVDVASGATVTGFFYAIKAAQRADADATVVMALPTSASYDVELLASEFEFGPFTSINCTAGTIRAYIDTKPPK